MCFSQASYDSDDYLLKTDSFTEELKITQGNILYIWRILKYSKPVQST